MAYLPEVMLPSAARPDPYGGSAAEQGLRLRAQAVGLTQAPTGVHLVTLQELAVSVRNKKAWHSIDTQPPVIGSFPPPVPMAMNCDDLTIGCSMSAHCAPPPLPLRQGQPAAAD
jgi:hypothetical protein